MTDLRPYQTECLQSVKTAYRAGLRRVLVSLPTGTGKTVVFASFPEFFKMQKRMLVLAPEIVSGLVELPGDLHEPSFPGKPSPETSTPGP